MRSTPAAWLSSVVVATVEVLDAILSVLTTDGVVVVTRLVLVVAWLVVVSMALPQPDRASAKSKVRPTSMINSEALVRRIIASSGASRLPIRLAYHRPRSL